MSIIPIIPSVKTALGDIRSVIRAKYLKRREKFDSICLDAFKNRQTNLALEARKAKATSAQAKNIALLTEQLTEALAKVEGLEMQLRFADPAHPLSISDIVLSIEKEESLGGENLPGLKRAREIILKAIILREIKS